MPELPEVETIVSDLRENIVGRTIADVNFLWDGILKEMSTADFKRIVAGKKIIDATRRAKNIYLTLEDGVYLLLHMKMTGHLIYTDQNWQVDERGTWIKRNGQDSPLYDPLNQFIRVIFYLDNGKILAFSDLRKFAYLKLVDKKGLEQALSNYGPEPLSEAFTLEYLKGLLEKKNLAIKKLLMDQTKIAGIGNIYADEILFAAKIHPLTSSGELNEKEVELLYQKIREILKKAVRLRGTSTSDFRDTKGKKGRFGEELAVYRRTGLPCLNDGEPIKRITVGGRGTHFCPKEQVQK